MGDLIQIRDYQSKRTIERAHKELEAHAIEIANMAFPNVLEAHYPDTTDAFHAPDKDPA